VAPTVREIVRGAINGEEDLVEQNDQVGEYVRGQCADKILAYFEGAEGWAEDAPVESERDEKQLKQESVILWYFLRWTVTN